MRDPAVDLGFGSLVGGLRRREPGAIDAVVDGFVDPVVPVVDVGSRGGRPQVRVVADASEFEEGADDVGRLVGDDRLRRFVHQERRGAPADVVAAGRGVVDLLEVVDAEDRVHGPSSHGPAAAGRPPGLVVHVRHAQELALVEEPSERRREHRPMAPRARVSDVPVPRIDLALSCVAGGINGGRTTNAPETYRWYWPEARSAGARELVLAPLAVR